MHRTLRTLSVTLCLSVGAALIGCSGTGNLSPTEKLKRIAHRFNENVRWQRFEHASKNLPMERRELWVAAMEHAAHSLRIVEYEMRPVLLTESLSIVELDLTYYRVHDHVIAHQRRRQVWKNEDSGWVLQSDKEHIRKAPVDPVDAFPDLDPATAKGKKRS